MEKFEGLNYFKYIGPEPDLLGHNALGQWRGNLFTVQLDNLNHLWAFGWHESNLDFWELITEVSSG